MELPQTAFSRYVDPLIAAVGHTVSWLWVVLLAVIVSNVFLRYALDVGRIEFEEIQWHLYSVGFMLGLAYAFQEDAHIRVDVLHEGFSSRLKAWIDLYGILIFVLPFVALMLIYTAPFIADSYRTGEISQSPGGLPYRWAIKAVLLGGFGLLGIAALSRLTRLWSFLFLGGDSGRSFDGDSARNSDRDSHRSHGD